MSKFIKVNAIQCHEDGRFLIEDPRPSEIIISVSLIIGIIQKRNICMSEEVVKFENNKTYFRNFKLIDDSDLDELIINI